MLLMQWPMPTLPSLSTGTLIAIIIALAILALFVTAITICCMLLLSVFAHHHGCMVASLMLSCQPPPAFIVPVAG
jgi:hypothetical protein